MDRRQRALTLVTSCSEVGRPGVYTASYRCTTSDATVGRLLAAVETGDRSALDELYSLVYDELRALAHRQRRRWDASGMLNTTALVHEAYLKLVKQRRIHLQTRAHFFALAATAIRHIVSNYARDRRARKRGGGARVVSLSDVGTQSRRRAADQRRPR